MMDLVASAGAAQASRGQDLAELFAKLLLGAPCRLPPYRPATPEARFIAMKDLPSSTRRDLPAAKAGSETTTPVRRLPAAAWQSLCASARAGNAAQASKIATPKLLKNMNSP